MKPLTSPGVVMGTVGYMSPEQVRGQETDHRSDIFSFGIILHEMLSGQQTFKGDSLVELMNAILKEEPPELGEMNAKVSPQLEKIVQRCLEKKPERRFQSTSDLGFALEALATSGSTGVSPASVKSDQLIPVGLPLHPAGETPALPGRWRERLGWIVAGITTLGLLAFGVAYVRRPALEAETVRLSVMPPDKVAWADWPMISQDGRTLAFIARVGDKPQPQLWVRPLNSTTARPLTEASTGPFWSADGRFLAFFHEGKLKKIALAGGPAETLCEANALGGTWNQEGVILFSAGGRGIKRISANGGAVTDVTTVDGSRGETAHTRPVFLPDGRHFLYYAVNKDREKAAVLLASLDGGETRQLWAADSDTVGVAVNPSAQDEGWLVFTRQGVLQAQPFDFSRNQLAGEPVRIPGQVWVDSRGTGRFSLAANGTLALLEGNDNQQLVWLDRTGKRLGTVGRQGLWESSRLSPDEQRLVAGRRDPQTQTTDVYVLDLLRGTETRFTFDPANDGNPIWSPDGSRIVWQSSREGRDRVRPLPEGRKRRGTG